MLDIEGILISFLGKLLLGKGSLMAFFSPAIKFSVPFRSDICSACLNEETLAKGKCWRKNQSEKVNSRWASSKSFYGIFLRISNIGVAEAFLLWSAYSSRYSDNYSVIIWKIFLIFLIFSEVGEKNSFWLKRWNSLVTVRLAMSSRELMRFIIWALKNVCEYFYCWWKFYLLTGQIYIKAIYKGIDGT